MHSRKGFPTRKNFSTYRKMFLYSTNNFKKKKFFFCTGLKESIFCLKKNFLYLPEKPIFHAPKNFFLWKRFLILFGKIQIFQTKTSILCLSKKLISHTCTNKFKMPQFRCVLNTALLPFISAKRNKLRGYFALLT